MSDFPHDPTPAEVQEAITALHPLIWGEGAIKKQHWELVQRAAYKGVEGVEGHKDKDLSPSEFFAPLKLVLEIMEMRIGDIPLQRKLLTLADTLIENHIAVFSALIEDEKTQL